jgi:hypothetical protein
MQSILQIAAQRRAIFEKVTAIIAFLPSLNSKIITMK